MFDLNWSFIQNIIYPALGIHERYAPSEWLRIIREYKERKAQGKAAFKPHPGRVKSGRVSYGIQGDTVWDLNYGLQAPTTCLSVVEAIDASDGQEDALLADMRWREERGFKAAVDTEDDCE